MRFPAPVRAGLPVLLGFGVFYAGGSMIFSRAAGPSNPQPIAFNHSKHIGAGIECTDCHVGARTQAKATLPDTSICMGCHESALTQSAEEAKLRSLAAAGRPLEWHKVTRVAAHVYFSHRRHVDAAALKCETCHGVMASLTAPPAAPFRRLDMNACLDCHRSRGAAEDCNACHR